MGRFFNEKVLGLKRIPGLEALRREYNERNIITEHPPQTELPSEGVTKSGRPRKNIPVEMVLIK